jgi:ADP-ribosylglycohydrolase
VSAALARFERTQDPYPGSTDPHSAGNGSLMRLAPVVLAHAHDPVLAVRLAADSSRTTHGAPEALDACRWFAILLLRALDPHATRESILARDVSSAERRTLGDEPLAPRIAEIAAGSFAEKDPPDITGDGYVVRSLEAALWALLHAETFRDGALLAVNLGDDADTTGAIYGQLAGAFYGERGIPSAWRRRLVHRDLIESLADRLLELREALDGQPVA